MHALVTGGAGFIGQHVVALLLAAGARVRVLDLAAGDGLSPAAELRRGSILDARALGDALRGVEQVFHLAALAQLWIPDKRDYQRVNAAGTEAVLAAAGRAGVRRFVHTSTEAVLAATADGAGVVDGSREPRAADMPGPYSRSKLAAEQAVLAAAARGLPALVVSPTAPLGPGDGAITAPTRMLLDFLNARHPAYLECRLNLVDVRDVAAGHLLAAARGRAGARYLLAGHDLQLSDLLRRLAAMTGLAMPRRRIPYWLAWCAAALGEAWADRVSHRAPAATLNGVRLVRHPLTYDAHRAREELGWQARPLAGTLADAVADLQARGLMTRTPSLPPGAPAD